MATELTQVLEQTNTTIINLRGGIHCYAFFLDGRRHKKII
jgi:hypothetical protein